MSENRAKVIAAAVAVHSAIEALLLELTEEQEAPESPRSVPPVPPRAPSCSHDRKKQMRTFGVAEHWVCEDCGLEVRR